MSIKSATAVWKGSLKDGAGKLELESGAWSGPYTWASRFGDQTGANPEELLGAAHAGCFSMFLSAVLGKGGHEIASIRTVARVTLGDGPTITKIHLDCKATVPGISDAEFQEAAAAAKANCPVSKALAGPEITMDAALEA